MEKKYSKSEIIDIIDREIKSTMQLKNEYIKKNGFKHIETINRFDTAVATLTKLYGKF